MQIQESRTETKKISNALAKKMQYKYAQKYLIIRKNASYLRLTILILMDNIRLPLFPSHENYTSSHWRL